MSVESAQGDGTRKQREKQEDIWIAHSELASAPGHPFYQRLNELLEAKSFDQFFEQRCAKFCAEKCGRPSVTPGIYFRSLLIGYVEGIRAIHGEMETRICRLLSVHQPSGHTA